jgi:hypothetical protein
MYKEAGHTFDELLHQAARNVYGDQYRAADDKIEDLKRGAYRVKVAANATNQALQNDDRTEDFAIPGYEAGQLVS